MKLVINLSFLGDKPTGLGVYASNCCLKIPSTIETSVIANNSSLLKAEKIYSSPDNITIGRGKLSAIKRNIWLRSIDLPADTLVFTPTHHGLPNQQSQIITIHDLICLRHPTQHLPQYLYFKFLLPRLLKTCKAVFTVSETSKKDIHKYYDYSLENIYVIPNGVNREEFHPPLDQRDDDFLLVVGARYPHKNLTELLEQSHLWKGKYKLVVTSCSGSYRRTVDKLVLQLNLQDDITFHDYVSHDKLIELYQQCKALVYISKWEGFGIPPLEALASGARVIASDIPVLREVLADTAEFIKFEDNDSWENAFSAIEEDITPERRNKIERLLDKYTWENAGKILTDTLLKVEPALSRSDR